MSQEPSQVASDLVIEAGNVLARVSGWQVGARPPFVDREVWSGLAADLAGDPVSLATLLDGDLPEPVRVMLRSRGLSPGLSASELRWRCGCGSTDGTCTHARVTWDAVESALSREPALMLTVRGCDLASLAAEAAGLAAVRQAEPDPGVDAALAYERSVLGLPRIPDFPIPARPERSRFSIDAAALPRQRLHDQAADAAARALDILQGAGDGCLGLDRDSDLARLGARLSNDWDVDHLAWRAGLPTAELRERVLAWRAGGNSEQPVATEEVAGPAGSANDDEEETAEPGQLSLF